MRTLIPNEFANRGRPPGTESGLQQALFSKSNLYVRLRRRAGSFHSLFDLLSGFVGHFERHVGYPTAALQSGFHGLPHHVTLYGCKVLRSSAGQQLVHVVHVLFDLMPNHLEVLLRHSTHHSGSSGTTVKQRLRVAG